MAVAAIEAAVAETVVVIAAVTAVDAVAGPAAAVVVDPLAVGANKPFPRFGID